MFMDFFRQINFFVWKKPDLSEFYLATIFSLFLFRLFESMIILLARWVLASMSVILSYDIPAGQAWNVLVVVTLFITLLFRSFLIKPLGLKIDKPAGSNLEFGATIVAVLGFYLYTINTVFLTVPMPTSYPQWFLRVTNGYNNTFQDTVSNVVTQSFWSVIPWVWILLPIACFYYPVIKFGIGSKPAESKK
jgi:hypothetical protein